MTCHLPSFMDNMFTTSMALRTLFETLSTQFSRTVIIECTLREMRTIIMRLFLSQVGLSRDCSITVSTAEYTNPVLRFRNRRGRYSAYALRKYRLNVELIVDTCRNIGASPILLTQATLVSPNNSAAERKFLTNMSYLRCRPLSAPITTSTRRFG